MQTISNRLIELRTKRKLNKVKVYTYLGITRQRYNAYENGNSLPPLPMMIKLCQFYNVSLDYLAGLSPISNDSIPFDVLEVSKYVMSCGLQKEDVIKLFEAIKNALDKLKI